MRGNSREAEPNLAMPLGPRYDRITDMRRAETLLREALTLPDEERAEIAGALLESLEPAPESDVESAWRQEVAARVAASEAGGVTTTPWEEIRDRFLARLSDRRQS